MAKKLLNNIMSGTDRNSHLFLFYRMNMRNRDFELLAPAGNINIFKAVIEAGADAVYVGGSMFGARAYANNFDEEELLYAIDYAHLKGVKVYLTVNTLLKNDEIEKLYDYLLPFYERGLDAVLVQDLGALKLIHDRFHHLRQRFRRERSRCTHSGPAGGKAGPGQMPRCGKRPSRRGGAGM